MKNMVLLWSTSVEKDSNIAPSLIFSLFFVPSLFFDLAFLFFWAFSFFIWPFSFFPHTGQCSNNDDHHTSIYLQLNDYNSILEQSMTLYECLRWCTRIAMMHEWLIWKNYELWLCHKYDVNYMIMQSNMTMMKCVIINGTTVSCMAIYLGMAMEMP